MFGGRITFLVGAALNGFARNVLMLILSCILLDVSFTNQSTPVYLSEMAPTHLRGMLNIGFQLMITIGIFTTNVINYETAKIKGGWGWCVSLALAIVPTGIITLGSLFLSDTPNSLIKHGHNDEARNVLHRISGVDEILEYNDLVVANDESKQP